MVLKIVILGVLAGLMLVVGMSYWVSRPMFKETRADYLPMIADPKQALTFARSPAGLIWVKEHRDSTLAGINLTTVFGLEATSDLIQFVNSLEPSTLSNLEQESQLFPIDDLIKPLEFSYPYVAVGTNFLEHAQEVSSDAPPFLFPKLAKASTWQDSVPFTKRLDFEAELGMFPLEDVNSPEDSPLFGLVLGNDFTDRLKLIKGMDFKKPLGETGFAAAKGCPGCMPTGYLVVIPKTADFYLTLELSLYVNDRLRQRFSMKDMILKIDEIIDQSFKRRETQYESDDEKIALLPDNRIPRGTLILTGTAAGVIFKPLNIWNQRIYLKQGDVIRTEATYLGHLLNVVSEKVE